MLTIERRHLRLKRQLERLIHVLLTHSQNRSESKEDFCRRCAWKAEHIIDELECPPSDEGTREASEFMDDYCAAETRIRRRQQERNNDDWG